MNQKTFFRQAIRYQKAISENAFSILSVTQQSGAELLKQSLDRHSWLPVSGRNNCLYWSERCIQATEQLRSIMNKGFEEAEKQLSPASAGEAKPKVSSTPPSQGQQRVNAAVRQSAPAESPLSKSARDDVSDDAPKDSSAVSVKQPTAAQMNKPAAARKTTKAATKSKPVATRAKSTATKAKSTATKAKSTSARKTGAAKTTRKALDAKPKSSVAASAKAAATKKKENPETAAKKTATNSTAAPASKQSG